MNNGRLCAILVCALVVWMSVSAYCAEMTVKDVYDLKQKAINRLDINEFYKCITRDNVSAIRNAKDPRAVLFMIKTLKTPVEYEVIREEPAGTTMVLYLKGKAPISDAGNKVEAGFGKAVFKQEGKDWKFQEEIWQKNPWK